MKHKYEQILEEAILTMEMAIVENDIVNAESNDLADIINEIVKEYPEEHQSDLKKDLIEKSYNIVKNYIICNQ